MSLDESTIPDLRAQIQDLRDDVARLETWIKETDKDVAQLRGDLSRHRCEPHVQSTELATLRIILRAVSDRLAKLEAPALPGTKGVPDAGD